MFIWEVIDQGSFVCQWRKIDFLNGTARASRYP